MGLRIIWFLLKNESISCFCFWGFEETDLVVAFMFFHVFLELFLYGFSLSYLVSLQVK